MKIFSIARLKTAAIARAIFQPGTACIDIRARVSCLLPIPPIAVDPSCALPFFCPCTSCSHFEFIVSRRFYHFCCFRDLLSHCHFLYVHTYVSCDAASIALSYALPRSLSAYAPCWFVLLTGFAYVWIYLFWQMSLYPGICARHRKRFSFTECTFRENVSRRVLARGSLSSLDVWKSLLWGTKSMK